MDPLPFDELHSDSDSEAFSPSNMKGYLPPAKIDRVEFVNTLRILGSNRCP
ncbi:hypothetical protein K435DRAFT_89903 [Dendrothele bispora CBS 962.96]|uniref:Uncharacterized protein n=1 Tax=Dendrothele bispora (strain CBS 962.96) TaxID=1314807 RepID=A0A4S8KPD8_DENBC|nr:hypothetical protein K435DRAFT_89903 [Dendrothele bispora CBS 962.96]